MLRILMPIFGFFNAFRALVGMSESKDHLYRYVCDSCKKEWRRCWKSRCPACNSPVRKVRYSDDD